MNKDDLQAISELLDNKFNPVKTQLNGLQMQLSGLQSKTDGLQSQINGVKTQLGGLQSQTSENTQMLRALEEASKVHKADMDNLTYQVASVSGEVNSMRKDISRIEVATAENWADVAKLKAVK